MTCYSGVFFNPPPRPIAGRIFFEGHPTTPRSGEATIWVCRALPETPSEDMVGIILLGTQKMTPPSTYALPLFSLSVLPERHNGRVALLDPDSSLLSVCPDLCSIGNYSKKIKTEKPSENHDIDLRTHLPRISVLDSSDRNADGVLIDTIHNPFSEDSFDVLDSRTVTLLCDINSSPETSIKQMYTYGIFGIPSLLIRGIRSPSEWQKALQICYRCFGELWYEGREFNGYVPRGILIDSPMALSREHRFHGCDFFCIDLERLLCSYGGMEHPTTEETVQSLMHELSVFFEAHPNTERRFLCKSRPSDEWICFFLTQNAREIYLSSQEIETFRDIFWHFIRKENKN